FAPGPTARFPRGSSFPRRELDIGSRRPREGDVRCLRNRRRAIVERGEKLIDLVWPARACERESGGEPHVAAFVVERPSQGWRGGSVAKDGEPPSRGDSSVDRAIAKHALETLELVLACRWRIAKVVTLAHEDRGEKIDARSFAETVELQVEHSAVRRVVRAKAMRFGASREIDRRSAHREHGPRLRRLVA